MRDTVARAAGDEDIGMLAEAIEERGGEVERVVWPRRRPTLLTDPAAIQKRAYRRRFDDRRLGRDLCMPVRYADDFLILVSVSPGPTDSKR